MAPQRTFDTAGLVARLVGLFQSCPSTFLKMPASCVIWAKNRSTMLSEEPEVGRSTGDGANATLASALLRCLEGAE
jgi:hypothetical protein